jgi:hypothetical protein
MAKLTALTTINHDGKDFFAGDVFDVSDAAQVAQLVEAGAAVVKGGKTKAAQAAEVEAAAAQAAAEADALAAAEAAALAAGAPPTV